MRRMLLAVMFSLAGSGQSLLGASIRDVRFEQDPDGLVRVRYGLDNPEGGKFEVRLRLSRSGDEAFGLVPKTVSGDVGEVAGAGEKQALWDVEKDQPDLLCDDCVVVVEAAPAVPGGPIRPSGVSPGTAGSGTTPAEPAKPAFPADFPESWAAGGVDDAKAYQHGLVLEKKGRLVAAYAAFMAAADMGNTQAADRKTSLNPRLGDAQLREAIGLSRTIKALVNPSAPAKAVSPGKAGIEWVTIPGGSFMMGSEGGEADEKPVHRVSVGTFQMARTEVTNKQYRACVDAGACTPAHASDGTCYLPDKKGGAKQGNLPRSLQEDDQPVVCVDFDQARAFSAWAGGRLPTEAEWEYAARGAGKAWKYPWGDAAASCERAIMFGGGPNYGCGRDATWPVCSKPGGNTSQGLCDMAGNVFEWTQDWYHDSYNGAPTDGSAWESPAGSGRVYRGGSWVIGARFARTSHRGLVDPGARSDGLGFRPAR